jgi:GDP-mannose 6-dehydrogenase
MESVLHKETIFFRDDASNQGLWIIDFDYIMKISIFGMGYVGAVSAGCLAKDGHSVIGVDPNTAKVDMINEGQSPIVEADIGEILKDAQTRGAVQATTDADTTMLPGTMRDVVVPTLESTSGKQAGRDFGLCNNPEFLREGSAVYDFYNPPKTVIGEFQAGDGDRLAELYNDLPAPLIRTNIDTAEMVKYVDNVWHALKVGFANEIGNLSKALNIDGQEVMDIFCKDEKLNLSPYYLRPGFAFGGSCLPKDLRALTYKATRLDVQVPILGSIIESNRRQIERGFDLIRMNESKKVGVLGFSFKSGTDDLRESPIVELIEILIGKGFDLKIYDEYVNLARLMGSNREYILNRVPHIEKLMVESMDDVLEHAELIVIGNGSEEFRNVASRLQHNQKLLDFVGIGKPDTRNEQYSGICW